MLESPSSGSSALAGCERVHTPARPGAELVHLAEELYVRLVRVGFACLLVGCGLTLWFATLERGAPGATTLPFVGGAGLLGVAGVARPASVYRLLRSRRSVQVAPAAFGALAVLLDGPDSQCYWIALPLVWIVAAVSSTSLAVGAAVVTGLAFLVGTIVGGQTPLGPQYSGVLPTAVGIPAYTMVVRVLVDGFAGLVLRHELIVEARQQRPSALRVTNLAATAAAGTAHGSSRPAARRSPRSASRLTARQLQVALLLRDGLRQTEIAACLGISVRQVERLLGAARERVGAVTTCEFVAMLARGALASPDPRPEKADTDAW